MTETTTRPALKGDKAFLIELYSGIQGEGLLIGERMLFLRFTGCNLVCDYCDTPMTRPRDTVARLEVAPGGRAFETLPNPIGRTRLLASIDRLQSEPPHRWISLTGGEPLLYEPYLDRLLPALAERDLLVHLETNGTLDRALERVVERVDVVAMDVKETADGARLDDHRRFLEIARRRRIFVKSVVRAGSDLDHYDRLAAMMASIDPTLPLILQPVTPYGPVVRGPEPADVLALQRRLLCVLADVRVIPQTQKLIGQL